MAPRGATLVDPHTRTFWARGADSPTTLIEVAPSTARSKSRRVAALLRAHEAGGDAANARPRGNPAFTEALFFELMRAHQYRRAFAMLSGDCRRAWGSVEAFATAQGTEPMGRLNAVRVDAVRHLAAWTDPEHGASYRNVAELDVEYTLSTTSGTVTVPRVVHLVSDEGRWWSLCYPR